MTLHLKSPFRWNMSAALLDDAGRIRYTLIGDGFGLRRQLRVLDLSGREAVSIRQIVPSLFPRFEVETYGKPAGEVFKDTTVSPARSVMEPRNWTAEGPLGADVVTVTAGAVTLASLHVTGSETVLNLPEEAVLAALGFLLVIRCVFADQEPRRL